MTLSKKEKEAQRLILGEINKALDLLQNHLIKFCKDTNGTAVPMAYIDHSIKIIKENMEKGARG
jgi:hypothetical protein